MHFSLRAFTYAAAGILYLTVRSSDASFLVLDQDFRAPLLTQQSPVGRGAMLPDGKFVFFAGPNTLTGAARGAINRFNADGSLDTAFNFNRDYENVLAAAGLPNGQLLVSVLQRVYNSPTVTGRILRLNNDGSIDTTFSSPTVLASDTSPNARNIVPLSDGKILISGSFDTF